MPHPLDEYPLHQTPLSMEYVGTSDRNFYDRWYSNAHDRTGEIFLITGLGVYANVGVIDAFVTIKRGERVTSLRLSDALAPAHRMAPAVGPYRIEVIEPLQKIRSVCEDNDSGIAFDLTWTGSFPAVQEQPHQMRAGTRLILDASRFAQVGSWEGEIRIDGETLGVDPNVWMGTRDRSWGIRPIGRVADETSAFDASRDPGFWWLYAPLRFEEYSVIVIVQERTDGFRTLNDATRVWADGRIEQLGWPRVDIRYRSGTRHPETATLHLTQPDGKPLTIDVETLGNVPLHLTSGYNDPSWNHGQWMGRGWIERAEADLKDPEVLPRIPFGVNDHVARATCDGAEGWGMFEHCSIGRHDPTGFADLTSVAP